MKTSNSADDPAGEPEPIEAEFEPMEGAAAARPRGVPKPMRNLEQILTGCAWQPLLPDAYHAGCRNADRLSRPYSLKASVAFLQTMLGLLPADIRAVVGPCYDRRMEEYRVGLGPKEGGETYHGFVWPLLGAEDEATDAASEIETVLREAGVKDVVFLDHHFPMEFCDDRGAPLYPNAEAELVHAEMPEQAAANSQALH